MATKFLEESPTRSSAQKRLITLMGLFALTFACIFVIRLFPQKKGEFTDTVASQIQQEMAENHIVLSSSGIRRTVADFQEPIILTHGQESRLIVHTARLSETISLANEGLGGWEWTSAYQDIVYEGDAQYTVDLSRLSASDFTVNNELKTLTVRIPYAVLSPISIPADQIKFREIISAYLTGRMR